MRTSTGSRKNLIILMIIIFAAMLLLALRVGWIQIVKGEEYKEMAIERQTKDTPIEAERGKIYDRNGEVLATSVRCYTVYATPSEIDKKERRETAEALADALDGDADEIYEKISEGKSQVKIAEEIDDETANAVREKKLVGIALTNDTKRSYPNDTMAANVLGMVNDNNDGQSGIELQYNSYLAGVSGRWVDYTDTRGNQLSYSYSGERYYQAKDGCSVVTTIDMAIQSYVEDALAKAMKKTNADRAMAIVMDPKTGDILALAQNPTFNPNDPYTPVSDKEKAEYKKMSTKEKSEYLSSMWRNFIISDVYEPGSVFKLLTTGIGLEEGVTTMDSTYTCGGSKTIAGQVIHCWERNGHGTQSLKQAVGNSCNPVFMTLATKVGITKFYDYLENFGITDVTGVDFPSEGRAILQSEDTAGPVGLAEIGFGQGIAVTPIQLVSAINSYGNDGKLMQPRFVKEIVDKDGKTVKKIEPKVVRQTISEGTAAEVREIMEYVVEDGGGGTAAVKGYRVGGKTGTANKVKNGKYVDDTFSSCLGMAPMDDPQLTVLVVLDSPKGVKFGSVTAGPVVKEILSKSFKHLNIQSTSSAKEDKTEKVKVPDVTGESTADAIGILGGKGLKYDMKKGSESNSTVVVKQYPSAGSKVKKGTKVYLYNE